MRLFPVLLHPDNIPLEFFDIFFHILKKKDSASMEIYIVRPGDTVDTIADAYGISAQSIIYNNQLPYPYPLAIGQALLQIGRAHV